ncbi:MAG: Tripartite tricarboxylate transporter family receptor [Betaproteobacteria bacterium]|nr:Tripartite tricarboxylate transporter family receptor [Betaproteobacteria bacterium]
MLATLFRISLLTALAAPAFAQTSKDAGSQPIRMIVGFLPGSSNDTLARFVSAKLHERLGQQVVVDNRPGANGNIGSDLTAKATPDGRTLLLMSVSHTMSAAVYKSLPFDPVKSFTPIGTLGAGPLVLVTHPAFPASNVRGLIEIAAAKPNTLTYASAGTGGINHFGGALFSRIAGVQMIHVPYKGGAPALTDVMGGQVQLMWGTMPLTLMQIRAGKVKALAVTSVKRSALLPDTPSMAEAGAPGAEISTWWGILAPAGLSGAMITKLNNEVAAILVTPESAQRLAAEGAEPWPLSSDAFKRVIEQEIGKWTKVAREANIRAE